MPDGPSLRSALAQREMDLRNELDRARQTVRHSGERGGHLERTFRSFVRSHLSSDYNVGNGEVFDLSGNRSRQTDILLLNKYQPFRSSNKGEDAASYIIEGVSAAWEIKAVLTKASLDDAIAKAVAFRAVHSTVDVGDTFPNAHIEDLERVTVSPPFFVFAYSAEISDESLYSALATMPTVTLTEDVGGLQHQSPAIDAIFILDRNLALLNSWNNTGKIRRHGEGAFPWATSHGHPVTSFLFWLYAMMVHAERIVPPALKYFMKLMAEQNT